VHVIYAGIVNVSKMCSSCHDRELTTEPGESGSLVVSVRISGYEISIDPKEGGLLHGNGA